jgi:hypothetical protein
MVVQAAELMRGRTHMSQDPLPDPRIRRDALVIMEIGGLVVAGVVMDDDTGNPIRLVSHSGSIVGMFAAELELVDRELYETVCYLEQQRSADVFLE